MTAAPRIAMDDSRPGKSGGILLGEDWVSPDVAADDMREARPRGGLVSLNKSPLARKIIIFNLMALVILVLGLLFLNPFRDNLVVQREAGLLREAALISDVLAVRADSVSVAQDAGVDYQQALDALHLGRGLEAFVYSPEGEILAQRHTGMTGADADRSPTVLSDFLNMVWNGVSAIFLGNAQIADPDSPTSLAKSAFEKAGVSADAAGQIVTAYGRDAEGGTLFAVASPVIVPGGSAIAVLALASAEGEIDALVRNEREQILQVFVVAILVSVGLSLVLASTIANPLSDLAAAAEIGREADNGRVHSGRVRIPDLAARPDEIGRLSVAMRGMVSALYDRIDANEQFAADVSHEIKNPLASLRSAVGSLRMVKKEEHREKLLDVIEHDVRRLDRLVSDISNASRLDSELVKEEEEEFDLTRTLANLTDYLGQQAAENGVDFITDLPPEPVVINGLEGRMAQVFVNLITNAVSFCEEGDAVRVWARRRENRVLVVVEDTGPGIPEEALSKVFKRFYSDRPASHFGNNSGLGLAISKQIVEAHGGVIWAENIRPTSADPTSEPLGARFVVGLPV